MKHNQYFEFSIVIICSESAFYDIIYGKLIRLQCATYRDTLASKAMIPLNIKQHLHTKHLKSSKPCK